MLNRWYNIGLMSGESLYWVLLAFLIVVFAVFYAIAYSIVLGIRDNYYRYAQKERLQWTGPGNQPPRHRPALWKLLSAAVASSWLVVRFIIFD